MHPDEARHLHTRAAQVSHAPFPQLIVHAQRLLAPGSVEEILRVAGLELRAVTGAGRTFASCCLPRQTWQQGRHLEADDAGARPASPAARSAMRAVHRRLVASGSTIEVSRGADTGAIFAGLRCPDDVATLVAVPMIHRSGRVWGVIVLIGGAAVDGVAELAHFATIALETAQRLAFARRDQDRLLLLAEAADDAFYDWDLDGGFWWGGGILRLYGSGADSVENTAAWKHGRIHPDDVERVLASFEEARASHAMRWAVAYRFCRHDGAYRHVEDRAHFLRDAGGRAYRVIGSMRDVSAMKELLTREQAARAEAESANRAKDEFLAMLGHELRNPLAPIVSGLELIRLRGAIDVRRELPVLQRQAQHLIHLVDDLLDISRIAHGKIELSRERVEAAVVIAAAVETTACLIEDRGHRLEVAVPATGLELRADRARLAQAVTNLLHNAAKYTAPGGTITVEAERIGADIEIRVRDTGIGIAPAMLPRVFNLFVQERQAIDRAQGGLGLGLSIVRNLVELHGGRVAARSAGLGCGSEFILALPAVAARMAAGTDSSSPRVMVPPRPCRIMVVDDNEDAAELLAELLEQLGHTCQVAHDGAAALELVERLRPEVAILDIGLPAMDGYELAGHLRDRVGTRVQLIALTGYGQAGDRERAAQAGFDAHLVKPAAIQELQALIGQAPRSES